MRQTAANSSLVLTLLFVLSIKCVRAQHVSHRQTSYWIRYQAQLAFSPVAYVSTDIDNRRFIGPDVQQQLITHTRLHYRKGPFDIGAGMTFSWAYASIPERGFERSVMEVRPVVEGTHQISIGKLVIQNRVRIDNRFFETNETVSVWSESSHVTRFRHRIQGRLLLNAKNGDLPSVLKFGNELMVNSEQNFFDQNRIYAAIEFPLSKTINLETGYMYIYQQRFGREVFFHRHVLRVGILHRLTLDREKTDR